MTSLRAPGLSGFLLSAVGVVLAGCGGSATDSTGPEATGPAVEPETEVRNGPQLPIEGWGKETGQVVTAPPTTTVDTDYCVSSSTSTLASLAAGLNPQDPIDYLVYFSWMSDENLTLYAERLDAAGTPCTLVADRGSCEADLRRALTFDPATNSEYTSGIVLTNESGVVQLSSLEDVVAYLGNIDTFNEAAVVMTLNGSQPSCGDITLTATGYQAVVTMGGNCSDKVTYRHDVSADGSFQATELSREPIESCVVDGRVTDGQHCEVPADRHRDLGSYMKSVCHFETAAVGAFMRLADELKALGAPEDLVEGAARAAAEEIEHAEATYALCKKLGVEPGAVVSEPRERRSLFEIAKENAGEGCVRELYGATVAHFQAARAADPEFRRTWKKIAHEETGHAEWSFKLNEWARTQLTGDEWSEVLSVRERAHVELKASLNVEPAAELVREAGLPTSAQARQLLDQLRPLFAA